MKKLFGKHERGTYRENIFFTMDAEYDDEDEYNVFPAEEYEPEYDGADSESGECDIGYSDTEYYETEYEPDNDQAEYYEDDYEPADYNDPLYEELQYDKELSFLRDQEYETEENDEKQGFFSRLRLGGLGEAVRSLTPFQYALAAMSMLLFITAIGCGVFYYNYSLDQKRMAGQAELEARQEAENQAVNEIPVYMDVVRMEEEPEPIVEELPEEPEAVPDQIRLGLVLTSMDKDLKIKIVDQDDNLVKDVGFKVAVLSPGKKEREYEDEDRDGIIYIKKLEPGKYNVVLRGDESLKGYVWPDSGTDVAVKGELEYKAVAEIKNEIKKEAEVNVAAEDTGHNNVMPETKPVTADTVEWCESTKTEISTEEKAEYVEYKGTVNVPKDTARSEGGLYRLLDGETRMLGMAGLSSFRTILLATQTGTVSDPNASNPETRSFTVVFADHDGRELSRQTVEEGKGAMAPDNPSREGYVFEKWDKDFSSIASDLTVTAVYREAGAIRKDGKLTDDQGRVLYKKVGENEYAEATGEDWANDLRTYYQKVESSEATYKYTGWQTIDGKTYYFKSDGTKVTGEQIIGGVTYQFDSEGALSQGSGSMGIDVSKWNGAIDWNAVKASGISYAIIRCGYRGSSTGALIEDPTFRTNIAGAKAAGLKVGVYFFTQAVTEAEAVEEASMCIALCQGYGLNYPVFMDVESGPRADGLDAASRTAVVRAFCETIKASGYTPGVYANKTWLTSRMNASSLAGYKIWLAQYNSSVPTYGGHFDLWQFTSKGTINGVNGFVDLNQSYLGY